MEVVTCVASNILNKLVDEAILQASYIFCFNSNVKELETERKNLQSKIQGVQDRAKAAKKNTHKVVGKVEKWLDEANSLMAEVVELQEKAKKRNKMSCIKHCPNLISRYNLAKQLEEKTKEIKKHNEVQFSEFSRLATLVGMDYYSSKDFVPFDSRKGVYDDLLRAVEDDKIHMIGFYGMGGSGKTTLVKEVGNIAEKFFDKVVFVVLSKSFDVRKIQSNIANQLSLELKEEETLERAKRLFMRLTSGERFLIILDDVWDKLNFWDIGIPTANNQMGCTTLITTRSFHVCELINCQKIIHLEGLNGDDSWTLFQKYAGLSDDHSNTLKDMAQKITRECGGLPVAIVAVASALKGKAYDEWVEALKTLRDPRWIDIEEDLKSTYRCLRLSYDNLEDEVAKSFLLLCCVYPEDYKIQIDQLATIGLGLGLFGEISSYPWAKAQVINKSIKKLIDCCLLLKDPEDDSYVKMHDLVHDVALWIAVKENKLIMGQLKEDMIMKDHAIRYLWFEGDDDCSIELNCPQLEFLYVSIYSEPHVTIPNDFFNGMERLRVLILQNPTDKGDLALQLPTSLYLINNLRCLMLYSWTLGDISFIGSLERLESLTIRDCSFDELPKCIMQQKKLRLLYLCGCKIQRNPFEVMGRCSQLEALYFCENSGTDWEEQRKNSAKFFDKISTTTSALETYCIHFGNQDENFIHYHARWYWNPFVARSLHIEDFENCISIAASKDLMRRARTLSLRGIPRSWKNIIPDLWQTIGGGMNELTQLALHDSDGIESVIGHATNPSQVGIISNLTRLMLSKVKHLKTLYSGQSPQSLFANLEELSISGCESLEHILTEDVKEIVDRNEHQSYENAFSKLKTLRIRNCKKLEYLMPISFAKSLAHLEELSLSSNDELRSVFGQSFYDDMNLNKPQIIQFSALKKLSLSDLPNVISICAETYHLTWPSLTWLHFWNCPLLNIKSVNHWVACGGLRQEDHQMTYEDLLKMVVAPLETLKDLDLLKDEVEVVFDVEILPINGQQINTSLSGVLLADLPQLRHIWRGPKNSLFLQHLRRLGLVRCGNLKVVFPSSILKSLPQLRELYIEDCNELEEIVEDDDQNVSKSHQLVFSGLHSIDIKCCHKLKCLFPNISVIPNLRVLTILDASVLEQVFGTEQHDTTYTPALDYVLLWNLPSLTYVAPSIALQTVTYTVVLQCPKLSLTSSIAPQELLKQLSKGYLDERYLLKTWLEDIVKSMDDSGRETIQQIDCQETGGQSNDQKLTFIASRNLTEDNKESEDQSAHKRDTLEEKSVKGGAKEYTTLESGQIATSLAHSEPASLTKNVNQIMPGSETSTTMPTSSLLPKSISKQSTSNAVDISLPRTPDDETELVNMLSTSQSSLKDQQQSLAKIDVTNKIVRELEDQGAQKENISRENDIKRNFEGSPSCENAEIINPSTHSKLASLLPGILVTSSTNAVPHIQSQAKFNPSKSNVEDLKDDDLISMLQSMEDDYGGESPLSSVSTVIIAKDELVAKTLADLEDCLKMPFKDIAISEANSLRLQTALNFLSRLSLEDGALPHGVMAMVKSMHKDLPDILSSFNQAFATVNKFAELEERDKRIKDELTQRKGVAIALVSKMFETQRFMDEVQEKEARLKEQISRLEKERKDCEAELLSLQEQKRKHIAETVEFKKEFENVRKEKSERVEDQRNARQQLFQVDHRWSALGSQFELAIAKKTLS